MSTIRSSAGFVSAPLLVVLLVATAARAQDKRPELVASAPESPAFTFLGVSPTHISQPGAVRELGAAMLSAIGEDGRVRQGFALEVTPWSLVPGLTVSLRDYQGSWAKYVLANTQLSVGTARAAGSDAATDLSAGIRLTLFDATDPMRDRAFTQAVAEALRACTGGPTTTEEEIAACADETMARLYAERTADRWNAARLSIGAAAGMRFENSLVTERDYSGVQVWGAGSLPLAGFGQVIGQASYRHTPALGAAASSDVIAYGGRAVLGGARFGAFGELVGEARTVGDVEEDSWVWSAGAELRIAPQLWLSTGLGTRFDALTGDDRAIVLANIRWGVADHSRLDELRGAAR